MEIEIYSESIGSHGERNRREIKMLKPTSMISKLFAIIKDMTTLRSSGPDGLLMEKVRLIKLVLLKITGRLKVSNKEDRDTVPVEFLSLWLTVISTNIQILKRHSDGTSTLGLRPKNIGIISE